MANLPSYVNKGTFASGTGAITPGIPTGITNEDFLILIVESANQAITAPTGWTEVGNQATQSTGTAATAGGVRLGVFYKSVGGVETAPTVADTGDHTTGIILAFRGVNLADPFNGVGSSAAAASTSMTWPTFSTTVDNTLILMATAVDTDAASTATVGAITAANLASITERHDESVIAGAGGGVHAATATKATAGALGTITATASTSVTHAYLTLALKAAEPVVRTVGQYAPDFLTPIDVGGSTTDGVSTNIYLQSEYDSGVRTLATTPKIEVDPIATSFTNAASSTHRSLTQTNNTDVTRNLRGTSLVYDDVNQRLISFGGYDGTTRYNEVWARYIDKPGQPWRKLSPSGTPPTGRNLHGATVVKGNLTSGGAVRSYMIVWSGATPSDTNDMYTLRLDTPGSEAWATVTQTSAPSVRSYMNGQLIATPVTGASDQNYIYAYGGWAAARENALYRCTFDVDAPTAVTWTTLKANGAVGNPTQTTGAVMAYKASTNKIYLYGGYTGSAMVSTFWEYDVAGNSWTNTSPTGTAPVAAETGAGGYDATNNRFWFTGGWTTNGTFTTGTNHVGYINDVGGSESYVTVRAQQDHPNNALYPGHSFAGFCVVPDKGWLCIKQMITEDPTTDMERYGYIIDFADAATYSSEFPVYGEVEGEYYNARDAMASIWNPAAQEWLNVGGFDDMYDDATIANGTHSGDIWVYNEADNSWRYANKGFKSLPPAEGRIGCYDSTRDRVLIFGGLTGVEMCSNEVWELIRDEYGNYEAKPLRPTGTKPTQRWLGACAYDATNDRMIIALGGNQTGPINDVWELSFTSSAQGVWTQRTPSGSVTAVTGAGYVDKQSNKRLYIFAGATNSALSTVVGNFIYLDYSTTNCAWNTVTQSGQVSRRTPAMDLDVTNDRIIVFGGFNGTNVINTTSWYNLSSGTTWADAAPATMPDARRSTIGQVINGKFYMSGGRPNTGTWYRNTWELRPNYTTPNSSVWTNRYPGSFTPVYNTYTGGSLSTAYHWQAWTTEGSIDSPKTSFATRVFYYSIDGNDDAPTDPGGVWTNELLALDNNISDGATVSTQGTVSSNYMTAGGTTAPTSGLPITQVRARTYSSASGTERIRINIYTDGEAENLGTVPGYSSTGTGWSSYVTLSAPTGGWTWAALQALQLRAWCPAVSAGGVFYANELEVTTGNSEGVADFNLGTVTPSYTKTQTTDAMKHTLGTKSHSTDSDHRTNIHYTKEQNNTLPTVATPRAEAFLKAEVTTVASDDSTYVDETGEQYLLYYFERWHTNSTDQISATWNGKSTEATTSKTAYLQIWNKTSSAWETLQSNSSTAANTDFTLTGGKTTSLSDYYDTGNKVVFRVYQ